MVQTLFAKSAGESSHWVKTSLHRGEGNAGRESTQFGPTGHRCEWGAKRNHMIMRSTSFGGR